jgi:hypothetical protein
MSRKLLLLRKSGGETINAAYITKTKAQAMSQLIFKPKNQIVSQDWFLAVTLADITQRSCEYSGQNLSYVSGKQCLQVILTDKYMEGY